MAIDERGDKRSDPFPERRYMSDLRVESARAVRHDTIGLLALAGPAVAAVLAVGARRPG